MSLPTGFKRAGADIGDYPEESLVLLQVRILPTGQVLVGIEDWFGRMASEGNEQAMRLLSSLPDLIRDTVVQYMKVQ